MKKVEKTTRPFRYDLNEIPYDYTVEVRNRFKGLDLIDRVPDYYDRVVSHPEPDILEYEVKVKVTNRFKGLNLVDREPEELWTEVHNIIQKVVTKTIPKEK